MVGLAERALRKGASVTLAVGAATADLVFPVRLLPPEIEYLVATDDGSAGHHGRVTELLPDRLDWADAVYACGPVAMMAALAALVQRAGKSTPTQIAMEERMGCSMGVCPTSSVMSSATRREDFDRIGTLQGTERCRKRQ